MEVTANQNVDLNSQFGTIVATHPHLQLNRNSFLSRPPSISFVVHPCPSFFARFFESRISSNNKNYDAMFKADLNWLSELDVIISAGKLFQSLIVLGQKLNLYASHDAWSGKNLRGWGATGTKKALVSDVAVGYSTQTSCLLYFKFYWNPCCGDLGITFRQVVMQTDTCNAIW